MERKQTEIELLRIEVEKKIGRPLKSPIDFNYLSYLVMEATNEQISLSTIKRLWGYVQTEHTPRYSTLSTFARFIGYLDWDDFCIAMQRQGCIDSAFLSGKQIRSTNLCKGDILELGWEPDRLCRIQYLGENNFEVIDSINAKLKKGDTFKTLIISLNHPLYATDVKQQGNTLKNYVAGTKKGITTLSMLKSNLT